MCIFQTGHGGIGLWTGWDFKQSCLSAWVNLISYIDQQVAFLFSFDLLLELELDMLCHFLAGSDIKTESFSLETGRLIVSLLDVSSLSLLFNSFSFFHFCFDCNDPTLFLVLLLIVLSWYFIACFSDCLFNGLSVLLLIL